MPARPNQPLQDFFDSPPVKATRFKLSVSAAEPVPLDELLALAPSARERYLAAGLDYPERYGPLDFRERIAGGFREVDADGVQITGGLDEALGLIFTTLVEPGDRVVVLTPCYPPQLDLPRWRGAETVAWPAREEKASPPISTSCGGCCRNRPDWCW